MYSSTNTTAVILISLLSKFTNTTNIFNSIFTHRESKKGHEGHARNSRFLVGQNKSCTKRESNSEHTRYKKDKGSNEGSAKDRFPFLY